MSIFDRFKKKGPEIFWQKLDLIPGGMLVGDYVKRILKDNNKVEGYIYLNDEPISFAYGNLQDIISPSLYDNTVLAIYGYIDDTKLNNDKDVYYFKLEF